MIILIRSVCMRGWAEAGGCPATAGWCGAAFILYQFWFPPVPAVGEVLSAVIFSLSKHFMFCGGKNGSRACYWNAGYGACCLPTSVALQKVSGKKTSSPWDSWCRAKITAKW